MNPNVILLIHFAATWYMIGLIWFVQLVHYPLMAEVNSDNFPRYEKLHTSWTTLAVGPAMLLEAATAVALLYWIPEKVNLEWLVVCMILLIMIWFATAAFSVPMHGRLEKGFDARAHRWLVNSNWFRTFLWSARGVIIGWLIIESLKPHT